MCKFLKKNYSKNVIVTGATGFVGQNLIPLLIKNEYRIIAISRNRNKAKKFKWYKDVNFIEMDIKKNNKKIELDDSTGLIHLAWQGLPNYNSKIHNKNLDFSLQFIESLLSRGLNKILITGTCFEYGMKNGLKKSNMRTFPHNNYGIAKDSLRKHVQKLKKDFSFNFQWARLFYFYGNGQNKNSLLSQLDKAMKKGERKFNMSLGMQVRDYQHVNRVVKQLYNLYSSKKDGVFNICSGKPITVKDLVKKIIKKNRSNIKLNLGYYQYNDYEPMRFWGQKDILG